MHDAKGRGLKVGDRVLLVARLTQVHPDEDFCNCSAESILGRRPDGLKETVYAINTGVLLRANSDDENNLDEVV